MNNYLSYPAIGVFLILVLFMAMVSFDKDANVIELSGVNAFPDSDCISLRRQCMTVLLNEDGTFNYKDNRYDLKQLAAIITDKHQNMENVHVFLNSLSNLEHQFVVKTTGSLSSINSRIKVSWVDE